MKPFSFFRRRRCWGIALLAVALVGCVVVAAWPGRWTFTVSPKTTYFTGPIEADGTIDYFTAINERLRGNITPETNANVLLWQVLGPSREEGGETPAEYFRWLGIEPPQERGDYLITYETYLE